MTQDDFNKALLLLVVYREARGEGLEGMRAVGHVVANRVKAKWGTWNSVITNKNQFSSISVLGDSQTVLYPNSTTVDSLDSLIEDIYGGTDADITDGSLYYANETIATSGWYRDHIINDPSHPVKLKLGHHTFRA